MSFSSGVVPGHVNEVLLEATQIQASGIISIEEVINGVDVVLSQVQVQPGQQVSQLIPVVPSTTRRKMQNNRMKVGIRGCNYHAELYIFAGSCFLLGLMPFSTAPGSLFPELLKIGLP